MSETLVNNVSKKAKIWISIALFLALFEVLFLNAMGNIVGAFIAGDLQNMALFGAMYSIYYLCNACTMPFSNKIGEKYGRKPIICFGILLFGAATTAAGFAPTMAFHVFMRGLQGIGQGFIMANVLAYFGEFYDEGGRAKAMGMYGTLTGITWVVAPLIGGVIGDAVGWRPIFYTALPLALIIFVILLLNMPNINLNKGKKVTFDWVGTISLIVTVSCLVTFFNKIAGTTFGDPVILALIAGFIIGLIVFINDIKKNPYPVITPAMFGKKQYLLAVLCVMLIGPSMFTVGSYLSPWIISVCGGSGTMAGTVAAVKSAVQMVLGYVLGVFLAKTGKNKLLMFSAAIIYIVSNLMIGWSGPAATTAFIYISAMLSGYGTTVYSMCFTLHGQKSVTEAEVGEATSNIQFVQSLSGTVGLSIMNMVLNKSFANRMANVIPEGLLDHASMEELSPFLNANILSNPSLADDLLAKMSTEGQGLFAQLVSNIRGAYSGGMGMMFTVLSIFCAIAFVLIIFMTDYSVKKENEG